MDSFSWRAYTVFIAAILIAVLSTGIPAVQDGIFPVPGPGLHLLPVERPVDGESPDHGAASGPAFAAPLLPFLLFGVMRPGGRRDEKGRDAPADGFISLLPVPAIVHREGKILAASPAFTILSGRPPGELPGLSLDELLSPGSGATMEERGDGGELQPVEISLSCRDGTLRRVRVCGSRVIFYGEPAYLDVFIDISRQRQAERDLLASEERYRKLGEIIPFGVWITDRDGNFTYCSEAFRALLGLDAADLRDFRWIRKLPQPDRDRTLSDWKRCIENGWYWDYEYRVIDSVGRERYVLSRGAPVIDGNGEITSFTGIHLDITELRTAIKRMEASLREKEMVIKEVHHRVKNNMAVISGFISLQSGYTDDPVLAQKLEECQQRVKTMALVHENLYQGKSLEFIDAAYYLDSLVSDLVSASALSPGITSEISVEHLNISLDVAIPCGLIVNELVTNSLKHGFQGRDRGTVRVGMNLTADHNYRLSVDDDGIGLPEHFCPDSQATLGMQLVKVLVNQLGGEMEVRNDRGAHFSIEFPEKFSGSRT